MGAIAAEAAKPGEKKPISFINLALGAALNIFEISTLGQPFEVSPP